MKLQTLAVLVLVGSMSLVGCGPKAVPESPAQEESTTTPVEESTDGPKLTVPDDGAEESAAALPTLGDKLAAFSAKGKEMMPPEMLQTFADSIEEVRGTGIVDAALSVGAPAVDAQLPDAQGNQVQLSDLWAKGPVVVVWYRGGWCPYCNLQLAAMQEALPAIHAAGATLVAITPETPDHSLSTSKKAELEFVVLSDVGNKLAKEYGIVFKLPSKLSPIYKQMIDLTKYNGDDSDELPLAATYVIDSSGVIRYAFLDADYTQRAEPAAVVNALKAL